MLENYLPVLLFILIAAIIGVALLIGGWVLSPKAPDSEKLSTYECGFESFGDARLPFDVKFYLVAILFILFDVETAFLVPWAVMVKQLGLFGILSMGLFVGLLLVGFIYEWKKGALEWE
jgi:NADH-quinone oxidoreductase subunit A